jgi:hypothetical protein
VGERKGEINLHIATEVKDVGAKKGVRHRDDIAGKKSNLRDILKTYPRFGRRFLAQLGSQLKVIWCWNGIDNLLVELMNLN